MALQPCLIVWDHAKLKDSHVARLAVVPPLEANVRGLPQAEQQLVQHNALDHGFDNGYPPDRDARIVPSFGDDVDAFAETIEGLARCQDAAGRLDCHTRDDILACRNAPQDTASMIAAKCWPTVLVQLHFISV